MHAIGSELALQPRIGMHICFRYGNILAAALMLFLVVLVTVIVILRLVPSSSLLACVLFHA